MSNLVNVTEILFSPTHTLDAFPESASSHHQVSAWRTQNFRKGLENGDHEQMVLNLFFGSAAVLLLYFVSPSVKGGFDRYLAFGLSAALQVWVMTTCRSRSPIVGFLIGFLSSWYILWSAVLLIFNNPKQSFQKVQRGQDAKSGFQYQSFPASMGARFGWALDLVMNSRGIGWNWKVSGTPTRPPLVEASLQRIEPSAAAQMDKPASTGRIRFETRTQALVHYTLMVFVGYALMDVLKVFVNHDPYFWGKVDILAPLPENWPAWIQSSTILSKIFREIVSLTFIWLSLRTSFALVPIAFLLFASGTNAEAWMYPDQFGSYSTVLSRGLAGFWGGWWHQLFRYGFQSAARWLTRDLLRMKAKSQLGAVVELLVSFYVSGFMHAAASVTMIGNTSPFKMFLFFALQPAGIIFELVTAHFLYLGLRRILPKRVLKYTGMALRIMYAHAWLYLTLPYLIDDLAKGGLFLAEPSPISPMRALGFGVPGDTAYPWHDAGTYWRNGGSKWWTSGLAL